MLILGPPTFWECYWILMGFLNQGWMGGPDWANWPTHPHPVLFFFPFVFCIFVWREFFLSIFFFFSQLRFGSSLQPPIKKKKKWILWYIITWPYTFYLLSSDWLQTYFELNFFLFSPLLFSNCYCMFRNENFLFMLNRITLPFFLFKKKG